MKFIASLLAIIMFHNGRTVSGCEENCVKCAGISQVCNMCKDGYWLYNNKCNNCPDNCEQCSMFNCSKCKANFWGSGYCDKRCPDTCGENDCEDETGHCYRCPPGFYGTSCLQNCTLCKGGLCDIHDGQCINGCNDGYFEDVINALYECRKCSANCTLCQHLGICSECDNGFYKLTYEIPSGFQVVICYSCLPSCEDCTTPTNCTVCKPGTYGPLCQYKCSDSHCYRCYQADDVEKCTECATGYSFNGTTCVPIITCSHNCVGGCDKNVLCVGGCRDGWSEQRCTKKCAIKCKKCQQVNNNVCTKCTEDFFTSSCNKPCNEHCSKVSSGETCTINDGFCSNGCIDGYWGDTCDKSCYGGCYSTRCNQTNAFCATCHRNYYGFTCEHHCSQRCADNASSPHVCEMKNGKCVFGCEDGYYGDRCDEAVTTQKPVTEKSDGHSSKHECSERKSYLFGILTGVGISVVAVVAGIGLFCFLRRRQKFTWKTADTRASTEEKVYENTAMGIMTLPSADTEYYNESKGYDQTPFETSLNVYERLQDNKQDDQQQYTELGRPKQKCTCTLTCNVSTQEKNHFNIVPQVKVSLYF